MKDGLEDRSTIITANLLGFMEEAEEMCCFLVAGKQDKEFLYACQLFNFFSWVSVASQ